MFKVLCIVGMTGSGKSVVSDELVKNGFSFLRFGQITLDEVKNRGLDNSEANERGVREGFRKEHGMGAFAILNIPKLDQLLENSDVVVDGLYSWSEYKILKEKYGELMKVIAVWASPSLRYERLTNRKAENDEKQRFRSFTKEEAESRDYAELENSEKGGPIAMADFTIKNNGSLENLKTQFKDIVKELEK